MQVYEGLPILTNRSPHPERLVGIWPLSHAASVGEYAPLAHAAIDEILAAGRTPLVVGGTGLYFRAALAELRLPPAPRRGARERWERLYDDEGGEAAHARLARARSRPPRRGCIPNDRRRVVRALELAEAGASLAPRRGAALRRRLAASDARRRARASRRTCSSRGSRSAHARCSTPESRTRCDARSPGRSPTTARKTIGLDEVGDASARARRSRAIVLRTRRYAAYQRKWLRRLAGAAIVAGDRPPEEIADEIVALARTRERLHRP